MPDTQKRTIGTLLLKFRVQGSWCRPAGLSGSELNILREQVWDQGRLGSTAVSGAAGPGSLDPLCLAEFDFHELVSCCQNRPRPVVVSDERSIKYFRLTLDSSSVASSA